MRNVLFFFGLAALLTLEAATPVQRTKEELAEIRAKNLARVGGLINVRGTPSGKILFVNSQKRVALDEFKPVYAQNARQLRGVDAWKEEPSAPAMSSVSAYMRNEKATFAVFIVDDPALPMSLLALEPGWAFVNVAALAIDNPKSELLCHRARVELARVFSILCGGASSQFPSRIMNTISKPADLNGCTADVPVDISTKMTAYCDQRGVKGVRYTSYARACEQGWAPAPTNDVQKAIWDKVHALPTEPIKIKPETKKVAD